MHNLIGKSLDRYQLVDLLGEGGMGAVFKARDITLQRDVAIKVLHPQFARRPDFRERFLQEARTAARLRHASIVKVFDFGQDDANLYIVMEFIPGDNLRRMLQDLRQAGQWILLEEALPLVQQISLALDYAHRQGILHRDIKPDNIMLLPEPAEGLPYRPVVTDLGLAKLATGGLVTQEGVSMGTPAYMSPEQAIGQQTDARSDVYSLGILLYELAVGRLPFPVRTLSEAIRYHTKEPPPPPSSVRGDLPQSLERVILKAIAKQPEGRFTNARELADALREVLPEARRLAGPPTEAAGEVSLMTRYQESLVADSGRSVPADLPASSSDMAQDRIVVATQDGKTQTVALSAKGLTIGRGPENDLVLAQTAVSRNHARVEFDGQNYRVIDLNSTNGTHLQNVRLLPGVPELWAPDKTLRIGDHWLQLQRAAAESLRPERPVATAIGTGVLVPGTSVGRIGLLLQSADVAAEAGGSAAFQLEVLNQGDIVDHVGFTVLGVPESWVRVPSAELRLMPGSRQPVTILVQPPRSPGARHGTHPLSIRATSRRFPEDVAEVQARLQVSAYQEFSLDLHPRRQSSLGYGQFQVHVTNDSNTGLTLRFGARDPEDACIYSFEPEHLSTPAGETRRAELRIRRRIESPSQAERSFRFTVTAEPAEAPGLVREAHGEWIYLPLSLSLSLHPEATSEFSQGILALQAENLGTTRLELNLKGSSPERTCTILFEPRQLVLEPGQKGVAVLTVRPKANLTSMETRTHHFQVEAYPIRAPSEVRRVDGEWTQAPPALELRLEPASSEGGTSATFHVRLTNREPFDLDAQLAAEDPKGLCRFEFAEERLKIPAEGQHSVPLAVAAQDPSPASDVRHQFTVMVRPVAAPGLQWQVTGEWNQTTLPPSDVPVVQEPPTAMPGRRRPERADRPAQAVPTVAGTRPHRFWALLALLLGLVLSFGLFYGAGFLSFSIMERSNIAYRTQENLAYVFAGLAGLLGLYVTFRIVRRLWRGS